MVAPINVGVATVSIYGNIQDNIYRKRLNAYFLQYKGLVTCVCFMGGDQNLAELKLLLIKCKSLEFKTCVYSGSNDISTFDDLLSVLDFLKVGEYVSELGGINSKDTNQRFYQIKTNKERQFAFDDKTYLFWNK